MREKLSLSIGTALYLFYSLIDDRPEGTTINNAPTLPSLSLKYNCTAV